MKRVIVLLLCLSGLILGACADKDAPGYYETAISLDEYMEGQEARQEYFAHIPALQAITARFDQGQIYIDYIVAAKHTDKDIKDICYNMQKMFAYRRQQQGIRELVGGKVKVSQESPFDIRARIITDGSDITWSFLGSYFIPGTAKRNSGYNDYVWYATGWPRGQNAYAFIYNLYPPNNETAKGLQTVRADRYGLPVFGTEDVLEVEEQLGFTLQSSLRTLAQKWGEPKQAEAYFDDGVAGESLLYFSYGFGRARILSSFVGVDDITISGEGTAGPRGVKVGDSFEDVLKAFPAPEGLAYEIEPHNRLLYRIPTQGDAEREAEARSSDLYRIPAPASVAKTWGDIYDTAGKVYYGLDGKVVKINYFAGLEKDLFNERIRGYALTYTISAGRVAGINLRTVANWISPKY